MPEIQARVEKEESVYQVEKTPPPPQLVSPPHALPEIFHKIMGCMPT